MDLTWVRRGSVWGFKKARGRAPAERGAFTASCSLHSKVDGRNAKRLLGFPAGAIPTVDFLLRDFGRVVKKMRVKVMIEDFPMSVKTG
jgi:hypothetical protein